MEELSLKIATKTTVNGIRLNMGTAKLFILENSLGQKVRTFSVDSEALNIVYLKESRRIEAYANLETLDNNDISYKLIEKLQVNKITSQGQALQGLGTIRLFPQSGLVDSPAYLLPKEEDKEQLQGFLQKSSLGHLIFVFVLIAASWISSTYFSKTPETPLVTIVLPKIEAVVQEKKVRQTVKVAQTKVKKTKRVVKKVVAKSKVQRPVKPVKVAKAKNVQRLGALAALGGVAKGTRGYEGLDTQSMKNIRSAGQGRGGGGVGSAGQGGIKGYLPGNGLIAGSNGKGGKAQSAGGYGTRGVGGGRAGYGKISLVGGTSAVSLPLDDEAEIVGGLDRDQIIAVINRHKGEIIYCYEKGLQAQPAIGGRVAVDFVIGPAGKITTAKVAQSSLGSKYVENCMLARMKTWQFPRPVGNVNVDVLYPFELMRVTSR